MTVGTTFVCNLSYLFLKHQLGTAVSNLTVFLYGFCYIQDGEAVKSSFPKDNNTEITESMHLEMEYNSDRAW